MKFSHKMQRLLDMKITRSIKLELGHLVMRTGKHPQPVSPPIDPHASK